MKGLKVGATDIARESSGVRVYNVLRIPRLKNMQVWVKQSRWTGVRETVSASDLI